jgi:hypothetical protein
MVEITPFSSGLGEVFSPLLFPLMVAHRQHFRHRRGILRLFLLRSKRAESWKPQGIAWLAPLFPAVCRGERVISSANTSITMFGSTQMNASSDTWQSEGQTVQGMQSPTFVCPSISSENTL